MKTGSKPSPGSSRTPCAYAVPDVVLRDRPRDLLPVLLRVGADRIETAAPAMQAHARIMREAADEIEALAAESLAAFAALNISQRQLDDLTSTAGEGASG